ncbi:hypothetical protein GCM10009789_00160 [Kribbella sancticallisti]|uniref:Uncharacterized protein n=1 Tax=Kribbella sancticallisti TaxID=460087 RepID=A0ABN2BZY6_9ACTN
MFADRYFLFPIVVLALIGGLVLLMRWAFSRPKGGSLVRRTDYRPADPGSFGLLVAVHTARSQADAQRLVTKLTDQQIRATTARTTQGWSVCVWPVDELSAREILKTP